MLRWWHPVLIGFYRLELRGKHAKNHSQCVQCCLQQMKSNLFPSRNNELVQANKPVYAVYYSLPCQTARELMFINLFAWRPDTSCTAILTPLKNYMFVSARYVTVWKRYFGFNKRNQHHPRTQQRKFNRAAWSPAVQIGVVAFSNVGPSWVLHWDGLRLVTDSYNYKRI